MAIWIQSLSWTLIYSLVQGFAVFASLWLVLKLAHVTSANVRYHLSLSALTVMMAWFVGTWWQQFHSLLPNEEQLLTVGTANPVVLWLPLQRFSVADSLNNLHDFKSSVIVFFPWFTACYFLGLLLMLARFSAGILQLFSLRTGGAVQPSAALNELFLTQKRYIKLNGPVKLLISANAQVPMVIGFLKPIILLPAAAITQLDPQQLETILLHELAHIKRHDYLVNILQTIVETILFFNPFVWFISTMIRREREHCCDDLVVNHVSEPILYATALASLASQRRTVSHIIVAATGKPTQLYNRIERIMEMKKKSFSYSQMVATIIIIATITSSIVLAKPGFSKNKKSKSTIATTNPIPNQTQSENIDILSGGKERVAVTITTDKRKETQVGHEAVSVKKIDKPVGEIVTGQLPREQVANTNVSEENVLVGRLLEARLVDQVKGFVVEKKQNKLYVNGMLQKDEIAAKYLLNLNKEVIRVQVFSMDERMRMHPDASFIQILLPATFSSPCVDTRPAKKDDC
jgi:beta-lactamase regulating signal transducer with metallopeptidase domain